MNGAATDPASATAYWRVWHVDYYGDDADRVYAAPTRAAARWLSARAWLAAGYGRDRLGWFLTGLRCERVDAPPPRRSL